MALAHGSHVDRLHDSIGHGMCRMMHLASPLEDSIRHELSSRDPAADDWLWSQQQPLAVAKFVRYLEKDGRFTFTFIKYAICLTMTLLLFSLILLNLLSYCLF